MSKTDVEWVMRESPGTGGGPQSQLPAHISDPLASGDALPSSTGLAEGSSTELSFLLIQIEGQRASMAHPAQVLPFSRKSLVKKKVVSLCCRAALALVVARGAPSQAGEAVCLQSWFLSSFPFCEITNVESPGQLEESCTMAA